MCIWSINYTSIKKLKLKKKPLSEHKSSLFYPASVKLCPYMTTDVQCCRHWGLYFKWQEPHLYLSSGVAAPMTLMDDIFQQKPCSGDMEEVTVTQTGHTNLQAILFDTASSILVCIYKQASLCIIIFYQSPLKKCLEGGDSQPFVDLNFPDSPSLGPQIVDLSVQSAL